MKIYPAFDSKSFGSFLQPVFSPLWQAASQFRHSFRRKCFQCRRHVKRGKYWSMLQIFQNRYRYLRPMREEMAGAACNSQRPILALCLRAEKFDPKYTAAGNHSGSGPQAIYMRKAPINHLVSLPCRRLDLSRQRSIYLGGPGLTLYKIWSYTEGKPWNSPAFWLLNTSISTCGFQSLLQTSNDTEKRGIQLSYKCALDQKRPSVLAMENRRSTLWLCLCRANSVSWA